MTCWPDTFEILQDDRISYSTPDITVWYVLATSRGTDGNLMTPHIGHLPEDRRLALAAKLARGDLSGKEAIELKSLQEAAARLITQRRVTSDTERKLKALKGWKKWLYLLARRI